MHRPFSFNEVMCAVVVLVLALSALIAGFSGHGPRDGEGR